MAEDRRMRRAPPIFVFLALLSASCDKSPGNGSSEARRDELVPDPITHPCVVAAAQYTAAIRKGSDVCSVDADCGCYQGGIGEKSGCGGVLNEKSVAELDAIARRFHDMKCDTTVDCAAWACTPRCLEGHCRR